MTARVKSTSSTGGRTETRSEAPAVCTIIARNYLSHARVLARSYLRHHPGGRFYLLVVDGLPDDHGIAEDIRLVTSDELGLGYFYEMCFKYDVTELSTGVKPSLLRVLMTKYGERRIVYLDPDIMIFRPMEELARALVRSDIVLFPHILSAIPLDGAQPAETDILIAGAYNLGALGLRRTASSLALLEWWEARLRDLCRVDPSKGLMVDQRWFDLVPSLFPSSRVLRDDSYDVAYWNLHARRVTKAGPRFLVNGRALTFFHFSGFDPRRPQVLSKHQTRTDLSAHPALRALFDLYTDEHMRSGFATSSSWEYGFSRFDNGVALTPILRQLYLEMNDVRRAAFGNPFHADDPNGFLQWATRPRPGGRALSPYLERMYRLRYDVAAAFPDVAGKDRKAFLEWASTQGAAESGYDPVLVRMNEHMGVSRMSTQTGSTGGSAAPDGPALGAHLSGREARQPRRETTERQPSNRKPPSTSLPEGVNVCGYLRDESGLGTAARGYVRALREFGVPLSLKDVSHLSVNRSEDRSIDRFDDVHPFPVNLVCINADQHHVVVSDDPDFFAGRYNIGVWAWELPSFPKEWRDRFHYYQEVWVGSSFIANALSPVSPFPVIRLPPVLAAGPPGSRSRGRRRLGATEDEFIFLFIFDFHSYYERKNPLAVVEAFKRAFRRDAPARLVVKCMNADTNERAFAELVSAADGPRITLLAKHLGAREIADLRQACDSYVSLHRSEGTGLTITEAMAAGKPVIATGWSGNMDFMDVSNSFPVRYQLVEIERDIGPYRAGGVWADPSIEHAQELMRFVCEHREDARSVGEKARLDLASRHSVSAIARLMGDRLEAIHGLLRPGGVPVGGIAPKLRLGNQHLIPRLREIVATLPPDAVVVIVSKGDESLLDLGGTRAWHFPQAEDGRYAGYHPANGQEAVVHLEQLRARGATHFMIPDTSRWWLEFYAELREHLDKYYDRAVDDAVAVVYDIEPLERRVMKEPARLVPRILRTEKNLEELISAVGDIRAETSYTLEPLRTQVQQAHEEAREGVARVERRQADLDAVVRMLAERIDALIYREQQKTSIVSRLRRLALSGSHASENGGQPKRPSAISAGSAGRVGGR